MKFKIGDISRFDLIGYAPSFYYTCSQYDNCGYALQWNLSIGTEAEHHLMLDNTEVLVTNIFRHSRLFVNRKSKK